MEKEQFVLSLCIVGIISSHACSAGQFSPTTLEICRAGAVDKSVNYSDLSSGLEKCSGGTSSTRTISSHGGESRDYGTLNAVSR